MNSRVLIARFDCAAWFALAAWAAGLAWAELGVAGGAEPPPAARWDFGAEETTPLQAHGGVRRDAPGPRPPDYPDFEVDNTAVHLDGQGARLVFEDPGPGSDFDFTTGDAITLEAWTQVDELHAGENVYIIGKGRTDREGFAPDNQNWALRLREVKGQAAVSFLFATPAAKPDPAATPDPAAKPDALPAARADARWHRWTTIAGFVPGKRWRHVAVAYRFCEPKSIRAWIDGRPTPGAWDMGGATTDAPVVDDDAIWIGSSRGGAAGNSFRGALDAIAIHRRLVDDAEMQTRCRFAGAAASESPADSAAPAVAARPAAETCPELGDLPAGKVLVTLRPGMPAHDRWLNEGETAPPEAARFEAEAFLLDRLPRRYDAWGVRDAWPAPVLARFAADVALPPGQHRFVLRARGLSRLWVDGRVVARCKPLTGSPSGEEPITPVAAPPLAGLRVAEHRQQEVFADVEIQAPMEGAAAAHAPAVCRVILETLVGGKAFRPDPGETLVAVRTPDQQSYVLLRSRDAFASPAGLTDADVEAALARLEAALTRHDDHTRRAAAASQDAFWRKRHALARAWVERVPAPAIPFYPAKNGDPVKNGDKVVGGAHPIDAFLADKLRRALAEADKSPADEARRFHETVLPILRRECFRCHGDKENGGLRLNTRAAALRGGDSGSPAVAPGKVEASELVRRARSTDADERMPPGSQPLPPGQIAALEEWIRAGAAWPAPPVPPEDAAPAPVIDDAAFLRRAWLDTVGLPPGEDEARAFLADPAPDKRVRLVDRLLADQGWADHWTSYWQDVLGENPTLLNASLNTTGPFRWFLHDALRDNQPFDRLATELILLRGGAHEGGSAGFGLAGDNDSPLAAKGQVVASAFLGIELQCARCHDSPYHSTKQRDLYALAAMFERKPIIVPKTSRVPAAFFESKARESLIRVTLRPDEPIPPKWPFADVTGCADDDALAELAHNPGDARERLAALVTSPRNTRFARVAVNRVWRRLMGAGLVEPVDDWEGREPSHPELLDWLAREFVIHGYDLQHLCRLIMTSAAYQRAAGGRNREAAPESRFFSAPERRRLSAEQLVDSLYAAAGRPLDLEELTFDPDGRRPASNRLTLEAPRRAWMLANLANERDRPSLTFPRARAAADLMEAFGWSGARQNPRTDRETAANVLQPSLLANGLAAAWWTRAARGGGLAELAVAAETPERLVDSLFLRYLARFPTEAEKRPLAALLAEGFEERRTPAGELRFAAPLEPLPRVTWSNHLRPEANTIALEIERRARAGPVGDERLRPDWRERFEDAAWSLVNTREFAWIP